MNSYDWFFEDTIGGVLEEKSESTSFQVPEPVWTTANGDKIPLSKMETRHICNCIKLFESKNMYKWYRIFKEELERRRTGKLESSFAL